MAAAPDQARTDLWRFWIDRGGTFTDCIARSPAGSFHLAKVLSSDTAPLEAIREILKREAGLTADAVARLPMEVKLGTTVATNALLERRGVPTALATTRGLIDVFEIGTQERPELFQLEIERPPPLARWTGELGGRRDAAGESLTAIELDAAESQFRDWVAAGAESIALVGMHAHLEPSDEVAWAESARRAGFRHVVTSSELAREIGFLARGETAIVDAYLTPLLREHLRALADSLPYARFEFMQSSGGLTELDRFRGPNALLSGPAGGVVGCASVAESAGFDRAIGFDMGGTSTDVALVRPGALDRVFETVVGGIRVKAPMLPIHTVAAGGGSLCRFDGIGLTVGPESAGSDPGPLCYARSDAAGNPKATELTVTDLNLALGRIARDRFPFPLDKAPVDAALEALRWELAEAGFERTPLELATGFFEIANASMAQAIAEVSVARGADPRDHVLVGFGGAGGQHVCAIARRLGMRDILLHPYAGVLSAYGIGLAAPAWDGERDGAGRVLTRDRLAKADVESDWATLAEEARLSLLQGQRDGVRDRHRAGAESEDPERHPDLDASGPALLLERSLDLGYRGSDTAIPVAEPAPSADLAAWQAAFEAEHRALFGYIHRDREVEIKVVRLRATFQDDDARASDTEAAASIGEARPAERAAPNDAVPESDPSPLREPVPLRFARAWFPDIGWTDAPVFERESFAPGHSLLGPALILEQAGSVVLDPGFRLTVERDQVFRLRLLEEAASSAPIDAGDLQEADPVRLEVLGNRFMSIAEQMGGVLRHTAVSTNIKERLDYSCAVFDREGGLVANAPHIPVHLGAMSDTVTAVRDRLSPFAPGDVIVTNDPFEGGSHLPDITVVTPVFLPEQNEPRFFVASRGHHADLGGKTPGSMPPNSTRLEEEGVLIEPFRLVREGRFEEAAIRRVLAEGRYPARRPDDNVADLEAMVAANRTGCDGLLQLAREVGEEAVQVTMAQLQRATAAKVARVLSAMPRGQRRFADRLDDGTPIVVTLEVEDDGGHVEAGGDRGARLRIDFEGTGPASAGNLNAPSAVVRSAVIYVLRSLIDERIPLNGGCLDPVDIQIPVGSILDPPRGAAVVGGNVETSQRVVDVLLGALGRAAASQGTMNNVTFGNEGFGYYETIGGGSGASERAPGVGGVHTHMTNTRITDPEVLEARFPVRLEAFELRSGSGGRGRHPGGDGLRRVYTFLEPVTVSLLTERRETAPFGLAGGQAGDPGVNRMRRRGGVGFESIPGHAEVEFRAGDTLSVETPGGGGFG